MLPKIWNQPQNPSEGGGGGGLHPVGGSCYIFLFQKAIKPEEHKYIPKNVVLTHATRHVRLLTMQSIFLGEKHFQSD